MQKLIPFIVILFASCVSILGCVCDTTPSVDAALKEASAVFSGRYVGSEYRKGIKNQFAEMQAEMDGKKRDYEVLVYKFEVKKWWKGAATREVILISDETKSSDGSESISDCGLGYKAGREYLIYAYGTGDDFGSGACTRTMRLSRAKDDIRRLNAITHARKPEIS